MNWLSIHDFIVPTNPLAAFFFGSVFAIIISLVAWYDTRSKKTAIFSLLISLAFVGLLVGLLYMLGYYPAT